MMIQDEREDVRKRLAEKMAGEITLSPNPGATLRKWRKNFEVAQNDLAHFLGISPSVISDYESGRRRSPGTLIISKIVDALLKIDEQNGSKKIQAYENILRSGFKLDVIYDIHEYSSPVPLDEFVKAIKATKITGEFNRTINGYTIIDSLRAILELNANEFYRLYGWSTERALIFTRVSTGRSPLVAIRVANLKPGAVVLHGLASSRVDPIARQIAEIERLPLMTTDMPVEEMIEALRK